MSYQHCNGKHDLHDISYRLDGTPGVFRLTRWCANCGAIVIDVDVDGRTHPGHGMPMRFPRIAEVARGVAPSRGRQSYRMECQRPEGAKCQEPGDCSRTDCLVPAGVPEVHTFKRGRDGCCVHCSQDWIKHEAADCTCPSGVNAPGEGQR